jgi:hypothetical protein
MDSKISVKKKQKGNLLDFSGLECLSFGEKKHSELVASAMSYRAARTLAVKKIIAKESGFKDSH